MYNDQNFNNLLKYLKEQYKVSSGDDKLKIANDIALLQEYLEMPVETYYSKDSTYQRVLTKTKKNEASLKCINTYEMMNLLEYLRPHKKILDRYNRKDKQSDILINAKRFMSDYISLDLLNNRINIKFVDKLNPLGECSQLLTNNQKLILIRNSKNKEMTSTLVHELAHALQFDGINNPDDYINLRSSCFVEVKSVFYELLYIDTLNDEVKKYVQYWILSYVNGMCDESYIDIGIDFTNLYSRLIAFYLIDLYQQNKEQAFTLMNQIDSLCRQMTDREVLNTVHIDEHEMSIGYQKYLSQYRKLNRK